VENVAKDRGDAIDLASIDDQTGGSISGPSVGDG